MFKKTAKRSDTETKNRKERIILVALFGFAALSGLSCYDKAKWDDHPCEACLPCETCTRVVDGKADCRAESGAYRKCGDDGFVYSYNSCDEAERVVYECAEENADCEETADQGVSDARCDCFNNWQGYRCDECPGNWDPEQACNACRGEWEGDDCETCPGNWDEAEDCGACRNHWEGDDCETCPDHWDPEADCDECLSHWDASTGCISCTGGWDPTENCETCLYGWSGDDCAVQEQCIRYVDPDSTFPVPNGASWKTAFRTIDEGIAAATATAGTCDVWVAAGTYHIYKSSKQDTLALQPHVRLYGGFAGDEISLDQRDLGENPSILDGKSPTLEDYVYHVITGASDTTVDGFTITRGRAVNEDDLSPDRGGGGLYNELGPMTVSNCIFTDNRARRMGGAIANVESQISVSNCIFANNLSDSVGGAVDNYKSNASFANCTFYGNDAASAGGALRNYSSNVEITNSILWNNLPEEMDNTTSALSVKYSNIDGGDPDPDNISEAPLFEDPASGDFRLLSDSPGVDAADGDKAPKTDLLGQPRIDLPEVENSGVGTPDYADMGALECHP